VQFTLDMSDLQQLMVHFETGTGEAESADRYRAR
jgi:hypothetical protein